uniref:Lox9 n=1 Tax=Arundo donax TaxID=35708 RepID=A0A0A9DTI8_ARUDO
MSSSATLRPTMSQSASRWPATASLRSSFCFRRTVSAARTATFSGRLSAPAPFPGAASRGR